MDFFGNSRMYAWLTCRNIEQNTMKTPEFLKKGDRVAIVCPAGYVEGDIEPAVKVLTDWGLRVEVGQTVSARFCRFAGTDERRAADLQRVLDDPDIRAVFAGRGGYGTVRIIDRIDFSAFRENPKWLVGFSDITVLHSHVHNRLGIATLHGPMPKTFADSTPAALKSLKNALFGKKMNHRYEQSLFPNRSGEGNGQLIGGNLAILHSLVGSPSDGKFDGKILFIEEVGEQLYNIDRMLWTLKRAKKLDHLQGLMVGGFTELQDGDPPFGQRFEEIIFDKVREFDYPVAFHCPAGHLADNHALVLGQMVTLKVEGKETFLNYG